MLNLDLNENTYYMLIVYKLSNFVLMLCEYFEIGFRITMTLKFMILYTQAKIE